MISSSQIWIVRDLSLPMPAIFSIKDLSRKSVHSFSFYRLTKLRYGLNDRHEITGVIVKVGSGVMKFRVGERVGVGCLAASCLECEHCADSEENYCDRMQFTYNGIFWDGSVTYGGYSEMLVADHRCSLPLSRSIYLEEQYESI